MGFLESSQKIYQKLFKDYHDFLATFFLAYDGYLRRDLKDAQKISQILKSRAQSKTEKLRLVVFERRVLQEKETEEKGLQISQKYENR